jgi:hypothetical protein
MPVAMSEKMKVHASINSDQIWLAVDTAIFN